MSRRKTKRKPRQAAATPGPAEKTPARQRESAGDPSEQSVEAAAMPGTATRTWISVWIAFHLAAIAISFTGVVETSSIHAGLSNLTYPYLRAAHFSADERPVYLAHGNTSEQPHVIEISRSAVSDMAAADTAAWQAVGPDRVAGLAVSDRMARWLSTAALLAEQERPGLVAELLLPIAERDPDVAAIRIVRLPTDLNLLGAEPESPYVARVARSGNEVALIQLRETRLSSRSVAQGEDAGNE